ncbi:hypothetical protein TROPICALSUN_32 [Erwinia phage vB_EamM_TropicalSun]|uniref:Uncharacterized protein n=4 Tax=Myosmarvirus TaxID=2843428 RepID=A0A9E8G7F3_9CAUD|nr:hypothetical protein HWC56_gp062 [Serratia phage MyoSmar]QEG09511.1 hypothetical protein CPT_MyoSmar_062 [Serratia phage MyoSmar]QEG13822.1 hypothetical protein TROPICALSUN_32 [Erwinia phage vB_EamM_TropicalSun]UZS00333.1 hypothetical protein [Serratia phage SMP]
MIITVNGKNKEIEIGKFAALEGWDLQRQYTEFLATRDTNERINYTMLILSHASVVIGDERVKLKTSALVDNHLVDWRNVEAVFKAVLIENGIDPERHAERPDYWSNVGGEIASSFIAQAVQMIGPLLDKQNEKE